MKAIVTGAEGFVGPYLIRELVSKGYTVAAAHLDTIKASLPSGVKQFKMDIMDRAKVTEIFDDIQPNAIFHLAAISDVALSIKNPKIAHRINVDGTRNIFEATAELTKSPSILIVGSAQEYGIPKYVPIDEEHPLNPDNPYAESKVACEELAKDYVKRGFRIVMVRSFNHIGPGQSENFVCSSFAKQIAEIEKGKKPIISVGNLKTKRDFTDVRDVVKAYVLACERCNPGEPYNVCSGNSYEMQEILDKFQKLSKVKFDVKDDKTRFRQSDIPVLQGSNKKLFKKTLWKPGIDFDTTLKDILDYWRKSLN